MTVQTALQQGTELLENGHVAAPRLTAEVLLSHALRKERVYLYAHPEAELSEIAWIHYGRYLHERIAGKPTQYITKRQEFYGRDFRVTPAVLIPRPETEQLVDRALELIRPGMRIVDVGCGSGAIAVTVSIEKHTAVFACDVSTAALSVTNHNAAALGAQVVPIAADLLSAFADRSMDLILSNPPYVPIGDEHGLQREVRDYEPHLALFAGPTGNENYQRIIIEAERVLRPGGWIVFELGYQSLNAVQEMLGRCWQDITFQGDLAGIPRILSARFEP
jgi:release factor glutamine methyltransferase